MIFKRSYTSPSGEAVEGNRLEGGWPGEARPRNEWQCEEEDGSEAAEVQKGASCLRTTGLSSGRDLFDQ